MVVKDVFKKVKSEVTRISFTFTHLYFTLHFTFSDAESEKK